MNVLACLIYFMLALADVRPSFIADGYPVDVSVSSDKKRAVLLCARSDTVSVLDITSSRFKEVISVADSFPTCAAFMIDSHDFIVGNATGVTLYKCAGVQATSKRYDRDDILGKGDIVIPISLIPLKNSFIVIGILGEVWHQDILTGKGEIKARLKGGVEVACLSQDNKTIAVGMDDGTLVIMSTENYKEIYRSKLHEDRISSVSFFDSKTIITASCDKCCITTRIKNRPIQESVLQLEGKPLSVRRVGLYMYVGCLDGSLEVYSCATGRMVRNIHGLMESDLHTLVKIDNSVILVGKGKNIYTLTVKE